MTREEKLQKAHRMFDNRNLLTELKWQREYFKSGYVNSQEELFNLWIFDECIKVLEKEPTTKNDIRDNRVKNELNRVKDELEPKPMIEIDLYSVIKQKYIEREVLDEIRAEIEEQVLESLSDGGDDWFTAEKVNECLDIIDIYKAESEGNK